MMFLAAGFEHIHEYGQHLFGYKGPDPKSTGFRGVQMHMGHYHGMMNVAIQFGAKGERAGFFTNANCRKFLQSGIACWVNSFPRSTFDPCCNLSILGGDGTHIGVPLKNSIDIVDVWKSSNPRQPCVSWGRNDRLFIPDKDPRAFLAALTIPASAFTPSEVKEQARALPYPIQNEAIRFASLNKADPQFEPLRNILKHISSNDSATGCIKQEMISPLREICTATTGTKVGQLLSRFEKFLCSRGIGISFVALFRVQVDSSKSGARLLKSSVDMVLWMSESLEKPPFIHSVISILCSVETVCDMYTRIQSIPKEQSDLSASNSSTASFQLHNPAKCGFNYNTFLKLGNGFQRKSWYTPAEHPELVWSETGPSGCQKRRTTFINKRSRCAIWVWMCMRHETVAGYHVIKHGEGRRDPLLTLYRFKEVPPVDLYIDCACQAEESALNWLPEYYTDTDFFHDTFHGWSHKCSSRFFSERPGFRPPVNTSLMEQFNSFLQPLRGPLCSGTTRVTNSCLQLHFVNSSLQMETEMFWLWVFVAVWNQRKHAAFQERSSFLLKHFSFSSGK